MLSTIAPAFTAATVVKHDTGPVHVRSCQQLCGGEEVTKAVERSHLMVTIPQSVAVRQQAGEEHPIKFVDG